MKKTNSENFILNRSQPNKNSKSLGGVFITILMLVSWLLLSSCMSIGSVKFDNAPLLGMTYDTENLPCQGAAIFLDGFEKSQTDVDGRFVIPDVPRGKHTIIVKKPGFELLTVPFNFEDRREILYLKVISIKQILQKVEENIAQKKIFEAEGLLQRAKVIDPVNPVYLYMCSLLFIKQQKFEEAGKILEQLLTIGYKEPIIYLTMADLYEYRLLNYEKAAIILDVYAKMRPLPEIKQRLAELVAAHNLNLADLVKKNAQAIPVPSPTPTPTMAPNTPPANNMEQPVDTIPPVPQDQ